MSAWEEALRTQRDWCAKLGSPLYARILDACVDERETARSILEDWEGDPGRDLVVLRMLGAVHRLVLEGRAPELAAHYPSAGGTPGQEVGETFLDTLRRDAAEVRQRLSHPPQTNEVRRSSVLLGGYLEIAARFGRPLGVLEVGASAGLNLLWDRFHYDFGSWSWGDPASPVQVRGDWSGPRPADAAVSVAFRRGCDLTPIDLADPDARRELECFVWPDQIQRLANLRAAMGLAQLEAPVVDRARVGDWLPEQLAAADPAAVRVVSHSVVWTYLDDEERDQAVQALRDAATPDAPVAWLRFEMHGDGFGLLLTTWPGEDYRVLATAHAHGAWVEWEAS